MSSALRQIEHLLPADYEWDFSPVEDETPNPPLRMARIVRRLNYIDLPTLLPDSGEGSIVKKDGNDKAGTPPSDVPELRELPSLYSVPRQSLTTQFCVAVPAELDAYTLRQTVLFEKMQQIGNAVVSFCIHPVSEDHWAGTRSTALHWKRFIEPFVAEFAGSGLAETQTVREAFAKFALPTKHLLNLTIRVAAAADESTVELANFVAAVSGGARAYEIFPPSTDSAPEKLFQADLDIPSIRWPEKRLKLLQKALALSMNDNRIQNPIETDDTAIVDFLLHAPHIFTMEGAERLFRLPVADEEGLPGMDSRLRPPFTIPNIKFSPVLTPAGSIDVGAQDLVRVGMVHQGGGSRTADPESRYDRSFWHTIKLKDLTKHALVVGSTGSGKTMTTLFLALELHRTGVPIMVIEPVKTEYFDRLRDKIPDLLRLRLEREVDGQYPYDFLKFDPFRLPAHITVIKHASYLKSCFQAAFPLDAVSSLMLETGLLRYYTAPKSEGGCELQKFQQGGSRSKPDSDGRIFPSYATFRDYFLGTYLKTEFTGSTSTTMQDYYALFQRRFRNLDEGLVGECFRAADERARKDPNASGTLGFLMSRNVVIELDAVPDAEQKALFMAFLLTAVFEHRQGLDFRERRDARAEAASGSKDTTPRKEIEHMLIVEEAHRVLSTAAQDSGGHGRDYVGLDSKAKAVGLFVDMLAEIRAYRQGIMIVEQIPTKIVSEAIKNTNLKIMLRLTSRDDRDYLGEAMNFSETQKRFVTSLKVSEDAINFVVFEEGVEQPLMLSLPLHRDKDSWLYDQFFPKSDTSL